MGLNSIFHKPDKLLEFHSCNAKLQSLWENSDCSFALQYICITFRWYERLLLLITNGQKTISIATILYRMAKKQLVLLQCFIV
jgi:hypothetical protein